MITLLRALLALVGLGAKPTRATRPGFGPAAPASAPIPRELLRFAAQAPARAPTPPTQAAPAPPPAAPLAAPRSLAAPWRAALQRAATRLLTLQARVRSAFHRAPAGAAVPTNARDALLTLPTPPARLSHASPPLIGRGRCAVARWLVCDAPPPRKLAAA